MEYHLDRTTVFSEESEFKNLYSWSLQEQDAEGKKIGRDWIPWEWSLEFKAKDISLHEQWRVEDRYPDDEKKGKLETQVLQFIKASLSSDDTYARGPSYSMLGTDRHVSSFELNIYEIPDSKEEHWMAMGSPSFTTEDVSFRDEIVEDWVTFDFYAHKETLQHYAERVASGEVDSLTVRLRGVDGFYAEWSPTAATDKIKILTSEIFGGEEGHEVKSPKEGLSIPRLGKIEKGELHFVRETQLARPEPEPEEPPDETEMAERPADRAVQLEAAHDRSAQDAVKLLTSLRRVAWIIAALLFVSLFL